MELIDKTYIRNKIIHKGFENIQSMLQLKNFKQTYHFLDIEQLDFLNTNSKYLKYTSAYYLLLIPIYFFISFIIILMPFLFSSNYTKNDLFANYINYIDNLEKILGKSNKLIYILNSVRNLITSRTYEYKIIITTILYAFYLLYVNYTSISAGIKCYMNIHNIYNKMHDNYILFSLIISKYKNSDKSNDNKYHMYDSIKKIYEEYKLLKLNNPTFNILIHGHNIGKIMSSFYSFYTDSNIINLVQRAKEEFS